MNIDAITVHFGDIFWTKNLVKQLLKISQIKTINIIYKPANLINKNDETELLALNSNIVKVIKFEIPRNLHASYDHAESLNFAIKNIKLDGESLLIVDTDIIVETNIFDEIVEQYGTSDFDLITAVDVGTRYLSHPCFILAKRQIVKDLNFSPLLMRVYDTKNCKTLLIDTGRLISQDLMRRHDSARIALLHARRNRIKRIGDMYLSNQLIHVGSSTNMNRYIDKKFTWFGKKLNDNISQLIRLVLIKFNLFSIMHIVQIYQSTESNLARIAIRILPKKLLNLFFMFTKPKPFFNE